MDTEIGGVGSDAARYSLYFAHTQIREPVPHVLQIPRFVAGPQTRLHHLSLLKDEGLMA